MRQPQVQDSTPKLKAITAAARPNLSNGKIQELEELLTGHGDIFAMASENYRRRPRGEPCNGSMYIFECPLFPLQLSREPVSYLSLPNS
jgi:hypothetical protein